MEQFTGEVPEATDNSTWSQRHLRCIYVGMTALGFPGPAVILQDGRGFHAGVKVQNTRRSGCQAGKTNTEKVDVL
eukprot:1364230-Rhodomonas_salina.2